VSYDVILLTDVSDQLGYAKYAGTWRVATELRNIEARVKIIEYFSTMCEESLLNIIRKNLSTQTLFVGISSTLLQHKDLVSGKTYLHGRIDDFFLKLKEVLQSENKNCDLVIGGSRINQLTSLPGVDFYFIGKADNSIVAFYKYKKFGESIDVSNISGRKYILSSSYPVSSDQFKRLDIRYGESEVERYEALPIELARGCIFKCAFCHYDLIGKKKSDYIRSVSSFYDEVCRNYEQFKTTTYLITDELINESLEKVKIFNQLVQSLPFQIRWTSYARLDLFHLYPDMAKMLLDSGASSLVFGIETLNEKTARAIHKGISVKKTLDTLEYLRKVFGDNVIMSSNFIIGLPFETEESIMKTYNWLLKNNGLLDLFSFTPLNIRSAVDIRNTSKISRSPNKYGYNISGQRDNLKVWENEYMNVEQSHQIHKNIYGDTEFQRINLIGGGNISGRVVNLGYAVEDLNKMIRTSRTFEQSKEIKKTWVALSNHRLESYTNKELGLRPD
jgi:hypothetical protein